MKNPKRARKSGFDSFDAYILILFVGLAFLIALADRAPIDLESVARDVVISERFLYYWQGVVFRFFPGPYVYRVLVPYLIWGINRITSLDLITIDLALKIAALFGAQLTLYRYLRAFFTRFQSFTGVLLMDSVFGYLLSFIKGPSIIETSDILNVVFLCAGLLAIWKKRFLELGMILVLGLLNRETPLILLPILFARVWRDKDGRLGAVVVSIVAVLSFVLPRLLIETWTDPVWFNTDELRANLPLGGGDPLRVIFIANARLLLLLLPILLVGFHKFRDQQEFLRFTGLAAVLLTALHYFVGRVIESRLWMPLFPLLIPLVLKNLTESSSTTNG